MCQRLRDLSHYFDFDLAKLRGEARGKQNEGESCQVFEMETTSMIENFTAAYMPEEETHDLLDEE